MSKKKEGRSTNLDSWTPEQLKMMSFGGNSRAQVFFRQHGWNGDGKVEAKYTSRAADLYKQLLSKEVAKSMSEEAALSSSPAASSQSAEGEGANGLPDIKTNEVPNEKPAEKPEKTESTSSPRASYTAVSNNLKKPIGAKKTVKSGGLGARKLTRKPSESLYEQKPQEPPAPVSSTTNINLPSGPSLTSRFEYTENVESSESNSGGSNVISHVSVPKSSSFFSDFGMDSGFPKKSGPSSSKVQIQESDEARKKFSNAKSISSSQFFGDQSKAGDVDAQATLSKFSVCVLSYCNLLEQSVSIVVDDAIPKIRHINMPLRPTVTIWHAYLKKLPMAVVKISAMPFLHGLRLTTLLADLFGDSRDNSVDLAASDLINRISFQAQQDISSLKNIAGETGKKLTSLASSLMTDLQDRIL
ncbi:putative ADP-ribosylation factor GTPase-activating protein [Trifolium pratense]|uniref:Putative ADP-ribosylation factor GTPase-activating protein n=2 Tax=Trifolium TaxID=3898 RepID=A0A2K3NPG0_TRIPR|nr:putative ADP-ribosylation factor GTPase-activating protein [Trifolium pratense]